MNDLRLSKQLTFNGVSSKSLGLVIQTTPVYNYPERDITKTHVPGRNGDIVQDSKSYKNVERTYSMARAFETEDYLKFHENANAILAWLHSANGKYAILRDEYDPGVYRKAVFSQGNNIENVLNKALVFELTFECKPQRYFDSGAEPVVFDLGPDALIKNETHFPSKPLIKMENLPVGTDYVTLLSTKVEKPGDISGHPTKEVSLITLRNLEEGETVYIDSTEFECYNDSGVSITNKLSLNGTEFPTLEYGYNELTITQYSQIEYTIPAYDSLIKEVADVEESGYSPKETTVASLEKTFIIPSYESVINENKTMDSMEAYLTYLESTLESSEIGIIRDSLGNILAQKYTVESPNSVLDSYGTTETFYKKYSDNPIKENEWCSLSSGGLAGNTVITMKTGKYAFIRGSKRTNAITWFGPGDTIQASTNWGTDEILELTFWNAHIASSVKHLDALDQLNEDFTNNAPWIIVSMTLSDDQSNPYITKFDYKINHTYGAYVWKDKVGVLGKAGWHAMNSGDTLVTYNWTAYKNKFTAGAGSVGILGSLFGSTESISYKFCGTRTLPQYDMTEQADLFEIMPPSQTSSTFAAMRIKVKKAGWYRYTPVSAVSSSWVERSADDVIDASTQESFTLEYIEDIPTFYGVTDWPDWIDNIPYDSTGAQASLNTTDIFYKLNAPVWFRKYIEKDDGTYVPDHTTQERTGGLPPIEDGWVEIATAGTLDPWFHSNGKRLKIGKMETDPEDVPIYTDDRYFKYMDGDTPVYTDDRPEWLHYDLYMHIRLSGDLSNSEPRVCHRVYEADIIEDEDDPSKNYYGWAYNNGVTDVTFLSRSTWAPGIESKVYDLQNHSKTVGTVIKQATFSFYAKETGYYKYGTNQNWRYITVASTPVYDQENWLIDIGHEDSVSFQYFEDRPQYPTSGGIYDNVEIEPVYIEGNPTNIVATVKTDPEYYKVNSSVNWKLFEQNDKIFEALTTETTIVFNLQPVSGTELDDVQITITPNWWSL